MKIKIKILVLLVICCFKSVAFSQTSIEKVIEKTRNIIRIYNVILDPILLAKINDFQETTEISLHSYCYIDDTTVFAKVFNEISELRNANNTKPYILVKIIFSKWNGKFVVKLEVETSENLVYLKNKLKPVVDYINLSFSKISFSCKKKENDIIKKEIVNSIDTIQKLVVSLDTISDIISDSIIVQRKLVDSLYQENFGPITFNFKSKPIGEKDKKGYFKYSNINTSFSLVVADSFGIKERIIINDAYIDYYKHKKTGKYKDVKVSYNVKNEKLALSQFIIPISINKIDISISENGNLNGVINLIVNMDEDLIFTKIVKLKAIKDKRMEFVYNGNKEMNGNFKYGNLGLIDLIIEKTKNFRIENKGLQLSKKGQLLGSFISNEPLSYFSSDLKINMKNFNYSYEFSLSKGFSFKTGTAMVNIENINGWNGDMSFILKYENDNYSTSYIPNETNPYFFGMKVDSANLNTCFDNQFEISAIKGDVLLKHISFDDKLYVSNLEIDNGVIKELEIDSIKVMINSFNFILSDFNYKNDVISANANFILNLTGKEQKLNLKKFEINKLGDISISEIEADISYSALKLFASFGFHEKGLKGTYKATLANKIGFNGDIDIGFSKGFQYGYLNIESDIKIPFPAGVSITKAGGRAGYNYYLAYNNQSENFNGSPKKKSFLIGLTIGVSDVNGTLFELIGRPLVQYNNKKVELLFNSELKIPRKTPIVEGKANILYRRIDNSLKGNVNTSVNIPSKTGKVFKANQKINVEINKELWKMSGIVNGSFLSFMNYSGFIELEKNLKTENKITGKLNGELSCNYELNFSESFLNDNVSISSEIKFDLNSSINIILDESGYNGSCFVHLDGYGLIEVLAFGKTEKGEVWSKSSGELSYYDSEMKIKSEFNLIVKSPIYSGSHSHYMEFVK